MKFLIGLKFCEYDVKNSSKNFSNCQKCFKHKFHIVNFQADALMNKFLIDGFPRNQDNLDGWIEQMEAKVNLQFVLFFECPDSVCIDRCLNRGIGRSDDNMESLKKRFDVFYSETMPIVDHYDRQNLVRRVKSDKPSELVFEDVRQAFNAIQRLQRQINNKPSLGRANIPIKFTPI